MLGMRIFPIASPGSGSLRITRFGGSTSAFSSFTCWRSAR